VTESILVATPHKAFGDLIRVSLEDSRLYKVQVCASAAETVDFLRTTPPAVLILDSELPGQPFAAYLRQVLTGFPMLRVVVVPPENNDNHPSLEGIKPHAFLHRPFYLPDLMSILQRLLSAPPKPSIPWINNPGLASKYLTSIAQETAAYAALIVKQDAIFAYSGSLTQAAAQELTALLTRYWQTSGGADLARFIRLDAEGSEFMLYATALVPGMALALVYDLSVPLTRIRSQAGLIVKNLSRPVLEPLKSIPSEAEPPAEELITEAEVESILDDEAGGSLPMDMQEFMDFLKDAPDPNPSPSAQKSVSSTQPAQVVGVTAPTTPLNPSNVTPSEVQFPWEQGTTGTIPLDDTIPAVGPLNPPVEDLDATRPVTTFPSVNPPVLDDIQKLEPVTPALSQISFTCILLPRMPQQYLAGELYGRLNQWVPQLCVAYGWRLENLTIRPEYLQWGVTVNPHVSPGNMVRVLRERTSEWIFTRFPLLRSQNPSNDFWAQGYLIVNGLETPTPNLLRDFIARIRRHQGV
jgi:REP element-mobilizing transposase RayT/CheY-like chemotaxis protein